MMLAELAEDQASGELIAIYAQIRQFSQVPYVSSLQRHLATRPGWLPWCWSVVGHGFRTGQIPAMGWQVAGELAVPSMSASIGAKGSAPRLDPDERDRITNILDSFIRVSPTNLGFSGVIRTILVHGAGQAAQMANKGSEPAPPTRQLVPLQPLPAMVAVPDLPDRERATIMRMSTEIDGQPFVPGLYRMLANWPEWFEFAVDCLDAHQDVAQRACDNFISQFDRLTPRLLAAADISGPPCSPDDPQVRSVVNAIDRYRVTSPQMVVYSRMLRSLLDPKAN